MPKTEGFLGRRSTLDAERPQEFLLSVYEHMDARVCLTQQSAGSQFMAEWIPTPQFTSVPLQYPIQIPDPGLDGNTVHV